LIDQGGNARLDQSLKDLLMEGNITRGDAIKKALNKKAFIEYAGLW
jgi:hypothetical protein